ncbi:MAG: hypothetical protein ACOYKE_00075 [Ferruginibacter sp.]
MKCIQLYFLFCFVFNQSLKAQNSEDVVRDVIRFTNTEWFQSLAQPGKKKYKPQPVDSVLIEYVNKVERKKILVQTIQYIGEFKNGLFHGKGKLLLKLYSHPFQENKPGTFTYEGDFENGAANGKAFLNYSWMYTPWEMKPILVKMNCQAEFENGLLKRGLLRADHTLNDVPVLTNYYSGDMYLKNLNPVLNGMGILYISKNSPGSEMAKRSPGIDGGFYAGSFFHGENTGYAICNNFNAAKNELSNLLLGIVGKGELIHTFSTLPVKHDWSYNEVPSTQNKSENFSKLFGNFKEVKKATIYLDKENKYTGGIKDDLPHGIGYIENGNGFYDLSFWNAGKRLSVKEVLGSLLDDSSMIHMKRFEKKVTKEYTSNKGTRKEKLILKADYFGKINQNGHPEGWGILLNKKDYDEDYHMHYDSAEYTVERSIIGYFNGLDIYENYTQTNMSHLIKDEYKDKAFIVGLRENDIFRTYAFLPSYIKIGEMFPRITEYYSYTTPTIAVLETESFKEDIYAYQKTKYAEMTYISNRKSIEISKVYLSSIRGNSYIESSLGTIKLQELPADEIKYGDFVLYNDVFYEVNRAGMLNDYIAPNPNNPHLSVAEAFKNKVGYVLKGYWMVARYETDPNKVCVYCGGKDPGKSTYTGVGYTGRYETNKYNNNSGGISIVTKPITTITTVTVENKPCKYCKGNEAKRRVSANIIRD